MVPRSARLGQPPPAGHWPAPGGDFGGIESIYMAGYVARARGSSLALLVLMTGLVAWPSRATAVTPDYRIGPGDVLAISVWGQNDLDQVVAVRPDGKILLAVVSETEAGGLTVAELASRLTAMYRYTVRSVQVTVSVKEIRSRPVFFVGSVVKPGPIQLTEDLTLLQALSAVGGPTSSADLESAFVLRGALRIPVNLLAMLQQGDLAQNLQLQPRDTVVVPDRRLVGGPGVCTGQENELVWAITPNASPRPMPVVRSDAPEKEIVRINVEGIVRLNCRSPSRLF